MNATSDRAAASPPGSPETGHVMRVLRVLSALAHCVPYAVLALSHLHEPWAGGAYGLLLLDAVVRAVRDLTRGDSPQ